MVATDGHTYEREAVCHWIRGSETRPSSPLTRESLQRILVPNLLAKSIMGILGMPCLQSPLSGDIEDGRVEDEPWALMRHIRDKNVTAALVLLQNDHLTCINHRLKEGQTALHAAVQLGLGTVALAILQHPEFRGVNARDLKGATALHLAAKAGSLRICEAICKGADFQEVLACTVSPKPRVTGATARDWALDEGHSAVARLLAQKERDFWAARAQDPWQLSCARSSTSAAQRPPTRWYTYEEMMESVRRGR